MYSSGRPSTVNDHPSRGALRETARTGAPWRDLPMELGNWNSVWRQFRRWTESGIWDVIFIILLGLTPLILLAVIGVAVVVLIMLFRFLVDPVRFFLVQQLSFAIVMIAGMAIAVSAYILTIRHALRQIRRWRQSGQTTKVVAGLVVFTLVAIIVLTFPGLVVLFFY